MFYPSEEYVRTTMVLLLFKHCTRIQKEGRIAVLIKYVLTGHAAVRLSLKDSTMNIKYI